MICPAFCYNQFQKERLEIYRREGQKMKRITAVEDGDSFLLALNNYNAASQVLQPGVIFTEDDLPELEEMDIRGDLGGIRELIRDYIVHAENGVLTPECSHNWRIVIP